MRMYMRCSNTARFSANTCGSNRDTVWNTKKSAPGEGLERSAAGAVPLGPGEGDAENIAEPRNSGAGGGGAGGTAADDDDEDTAACTGVQWLLLTIALADEELMLRDEAADTVAHGNALPAAVKDDEAEVEAFNPRGKTADEVADDDGSERAELLPKEAPGRENGVTVWSDDDEAPAMAIVATRLELFRIDESCRS